MKQNLLYTIIMFVGLANMTLHSQSKVDSLEKKVQIATGKEKIILFYDLIRTCRESDLYDKALAHAKEALKLSKQLNNVLYQADFINEFGIYYDHKMVLDSALFYYLKALSLFESDKNKPGQAMAFSNIGNVYRLMRNYSKSEQYLKLGLRLRKELGNKEQIAHASNGLGSYYYDVAQLDSSLFYFEQALIHFRSVNDKAMTAQCENNIGSIYNEFGKYKEAIDMYTSALSIYTELGSEYDRTMCLANIGNVYNVWGDPKQGVSYAKDALKAARAMNAKNLIVPIYIFLIEGSQMLKDYGAVIKYQADLINYKDTIYDSQTNENIAAMQTKFDTDKKEKENQILRQQNDLQSFSIKQQKIVSYSVIFGLILVIALAFYIYKGYRQKQKANLLLEEKNNVIEEKNKMVEEKQKEIIDSINYAKRIQYTLLAHVDFMKANLPDHFVLFNPKDIVSGDFYWATLHEDKFYLAVCDSTGHGVPGAFMSLLNIGYLSEAINEKNITQPNEVFDYVRERLVNTVSKEGQRDGFDGILMCFDFANKQLSYAAANNRPLLIRDNSLVELPLDRIPVGISEQAKSFNLYKLEIEKGDVLYLYTDGYADQFGGPKGKKFKYRTLNELILANHGDDMQQQQIALTNNFSAWRGELEQVDDVCIIGIRI